VNDTRPNDDLATTAATAWCPGCGNFGILDAFKKAVRTLEGRGVPRERLVMAAGIGQHAKIFDYVALSGFYSLHGRAIATAQGIKLANPDLSVITFVGDGDTMGEGIEHLIFAAKRNSDITVVVHDNGVYALTTGQRAPTSVRGYRGPSTPHGNVEDPLNPLVIALEAGATFVARGYSARKDELADLMVAAVLHKGFSFIDVLQPCVTFNNTYAAYERLTEPLAGGPRTFEEALTLARRQDRLPLGVFYRGEKPSHEEALLGGLNPVAAHPSRDGRLGQVAGLMAGSAKQP
jgi:2-oxoglutarate ferredoxin oxidoreductase subunit beta